MPAARIIPCLDVRDGRVVKGVQFRDHRDAGDILEHALRYRDEGADELVFYDIGASAEDRGLDMAWVFRIGAIIDIPFAVAGGILGLYVAGLNLSVSAAVGFISLFGVAAMDGILLVSYIRRDLDEGMDTETAIIQAGEARMRQVFMTGFSACIGLVPAAISTGIGSQVQQPLACVIVGGMLLSPICSLLVIPTVARLMMRQVAGRSAGAEPRAEPA